MIRVGADFSADPAMDQPGLIVDMRGGIEKINGGRKG